WVRLGGIRSVRLRPEDGAELRVVSRDNPIGRGHSRTEDCRVLVVGAGNSYQAARWIFEYRAALSFGFSCARRMRTARRSEDDGMAGREMHGVRRHHGA